MTTPNGQKDVSNWLTSLPMKEHGFDLSSQEFRDAIRIHYGWQLERLSVMCACGSSFGVPYPAKLELCNLEAKRSLRHNSRTVCQDVRKEPILGKVVPGELLKRSSNISREARLDVSAVWVPGQRAFFDIRVFDLTAQRT